MKLTGWTLVAALCWAATAWSQDSSELPAERMPLVDQSLLLDVTATDTGWVAVGERGHVLLSADGETWRQAAEVPTRSTLTAVTAVGEQLWAVGHDVIILHSADGGEHWAIQQVDPEMMQPLLAVHFMDADNGLAVGAYGYFVRTADGGETWEEGMTFAEADDDALDDEEAVEEDEYADDDALEEPATGNYDFSDYEDEITDFHMNGIAETADGTLYIAAEAGTGLRSEDGGETWSRIELPYAGSMFGVLVSNDGRLVTYGLRGHVLESEDGGMNWLEQDTGTLNSLLGGDVLDDGRIVLVGANGEVLIRDPEDGSYRSTQTADGDDLAAAAVIDGNRLVTVGESGTATHTTQGGRP